MNIDITDYGIEGEYAFISYFLNNEPEAVLEVEFEALVTHVEYEGLCDSWGYGATEEAGTREIVDVYQDPTIWTTENLKEALESYLKFTLKGKQ